MTTTSTLTIGVGNGKGGVGASTLCFQFASQLQSLGSKVTLVETSASKSGLLWCVDRAERRLQVMNCSRQSVDYLHLQDCPTWLWSYELGSDVVLLDFSNGALDLGTAMRHVTHWVCPLGPNDVRHTLASHALWRATHPEAWSERKTFTGVLVVPGREIALDGSYASSRANGDQTVGQLLRLDPDINVARQRVTRSEAMADTWGGWDTQSEKTPETVAARTEIERLWSELTATMASGGVAPQPAAPAHWAWFGGRPKPFSFDRSRNTPSLEPRRWR